MRPAGGPSYDTGASGVPDPSSGSGVPDPPGASAASTSDAAPAWRTARGPVSLEPPLVMGVLNVTPDSFSDAGELDTPDAALRRAESMAAAGAGMLDVGGESTRPGAAEVPEEEELRRVLPVVERLERELDLPVSVDTRKSGVARRALEAGAAVINDVSGLRFDPNLAQVVGEAGAGLVLMHMRGTPADMREHTRYRDLADDVVEELREAVARARAGGVPDDALVLDPGIGFAKTAEQSFRLVDEIGRLVELGFPVLVGPSRKSFLGALLDVPPRERVLAGAVVCALAWERGASIFRVHDVREAVQALEVARAVKGARGVPSARSSADPGVGRGVLEGDDGTEPGGGKETHE